LAVTEIRRNLERQTGRRRALLTPAASPVT